MAETKLRKRKPSVRKTATLASGSGLAKHRENHRYEHSYLVHTTIRASPLSKESPEQNYRGFFNLAMLLLFVNNARLAVENMTKYGLLMSIPGIDVSRSDWIWSAIALFTVPCFVFNALFIEMISAKSLTGLVKDVSLRNLQYAHALNTAMCACLPTYICWNFIFNPVVSSVPLFVSTITALKLVSFALANKDLRNERIYGSHRLQNEESHEAPLVNPSCETSFDPDTLPYPQNLTVKNIFYFWAAPTLCYQPTYPRTSCFRSSFFFKRLLECSTALFAIYFLIQQYAAPTLRNSLNTPHNQFQIVFYLERILKLSVTSIYIWLLMFYAYFHSFLNAVAELLKFGDRRFYQCWWNATDIASYWRQWNTPVYMFNKRHIFLPLQCNLKAPRYLSTLLIFSLSGILHELLVAVPIKHIGGWGFGGMMAQLPLIFLTNQLLVLRKIVRSNIYKRYEKAPVPARPSPTTAATAAGEASREELEFVKGNTAILPHNDVAESEVNKMAAFFDTVGNLVFWVSFCIVGQPVGIMMCYWEWVRKYGI